MDADPLIRAAIEQRRLVQLVYFEKVRIAEPHDYGVHKGAVKLLAFQGRRIEQRTIAELAMVRGGADYRDPGARTDVQGWARRGVDEAP